jgi:hypothetical protein
MKLWDEYEFNVEDTTHDMEGNPMIEITLYLKTNADRHDAINALSDYLEEGLKVNA